MIDRFLGFFDSLGHFFSFMGSLIIEIDEFIPPYVSMALAMVMAFAFILLVIRFALALISVAKTIALGVLMFFGG